LSSDGKADAFISWRVPIADLTTVLAKASPALTRTPWCSMCPSPRPRPGRSTAT
jgi:hypothetical protein